MGDVVEGLPEPVDLQIAADQRGRLSHAIAEQLRCEHRSARRSDIRARGRHPLCSDDLLVEPSRLHLGLDAELSLQGIDAQPVLSEGISAPSLTVEESHQRTMGGLVRRVERKDPHGGLNGRLDDAGSVLLFEQPAQRLLRQLA
jgi:hypothetical protein